MQCAQGLKNMFCLPFKFAKSTAANNKKINMHLLCSFTYHVLWVSFQKQSFCFYLQTFVHIYTYIYAQLKSPRIYMHYYQHNMYLFANQSWCCQIIVPLSGCTGQPQMKKVDKFGYLPSFLCTYVMRERVIQRQLLVGLSLQIPPSRLLDTQLLLLHPQ